MYFYFFFVQRLTGSSLERAQAEIESKASKLFLSPQQDFCCYTTKIPQLRAAPWQAEARDYSIVYAFQSRIFALLCG